MKLRILLLTAFMSALIANAQTLLKHIPVTDGGINAIVTKGDTLIVGGNFNRLFYEDSIGKNGCLINAATGNVHGKSDMPDAPVLSSTSDDQGGYIIAGRFSHVGDSIRNGIAHINKDGRVTDKLRNAWFDNNTISGLIKHGDTLFATGNFMMAGAENIKTTSAAFAINSAVPDKAYPITNGTISTILSDGAGGWFIAGNFSQVNGVARSCIAKVAANGTVASFNNSITGHITSLVLTGNTLYIGGYFQVSGFTDHKHLIAVDANTGNLITGFKPTINGSVLSIALGGNTLYLGGNFTTVNGQTRKGLAAIDVTSYVLTSFNVTMLTPFGASYPPTVYQLALFNNQLFMTGDFSKVGGQDRARIASVSTSGPVSTFNPQFDGGTYAENFHITSEGGVLYVAGYFRKVGTQTRPHFAAFDMQSDQLKSQRIKDSDSSRFYQVSAISVRQGKVYLAGLIKPSATSADNRYNTVVVLDTLNNAITETGIYTSRDFTGNIPYFIQALAVSANQIYVGGIFKSIGGKPVSQLAALDFNTGNPLPWETDVHFHSSRNDTDLIFTGFVRYKDHLYIGGYFDVFRNMGVPFGNTLVAINIPTGKSSSWNPQFQSASVAAPGGNIYSMAAKDNLLYCIGSFGKVSNQTRKIPCFDLNTHTLTSWNPTGILGTGFEAITVSGNTVFIVGDAITYNSEDYDVVAFNATTAAIHTWDQQGTPYNQYGIWSSIAVSGDWLYYAGKTYDQTAQVMRGALNVLNIHTGKPAHFTPHVDSPVYHLNAIGNHIVAGGKFVSLGGYKRYNLGVISLVNGMVLSTPSSFYCSEVRDMKLSGRNLYVCNLSSMKAFDVHKLTVLSSFNPNIMGVISHLEATDTRLYVAGYDRLYCLDRNTGAAYSWPHGPITGNIYTMKISGSRIYVAGDFTVMAGQNRKHLASFDLSTLSLTSWNPAPNYPVYGLATSNNRLFVAGNFHNIAGVPKRYLAAFDSSQNLLSWDAQADSVVGSIAAIGNSLYVRGEFTRIGSKTVSRIADIDAITATAGNFTAQPDGDPYWNEVFSYSSFLGIQYAGKHLGQERRSHFALFSTGGAGLQLGTVTPLKLCPGKPISVGFSYTGPIMSGTNIIAQLSDANGTFQSFTEIGNAPSAASGTINGFVSNNAAASDNYKIRLYSPDPFVFSGQTQSLSISAKPAKPKITVTGNVLGTETSFAYQWYRNNSPISGVNGTKQTYSAAQSGYYQVELTNQDGCSSKSDSLNHVFTSTDERNPEIAKLYPNPASGSFKISSTNMILKVMIYDIYGKEVYTAQNPSAAFTEVICEGILQPGYYFVEVSTDSGMGVYRLILK